MVVVTGLFAGTQNLGFLRGTAPVTQCRSNGVTNYCCDLGLDAKEDVRLDGMYMKYDNVTHRFLSGGKATPISFEHAFRLATSHPSFG